MMSETDCPSVDNWCDTYVEVTKTSFLWTIHNFGYSLLQVGSGRSFKSTSFSDSADSPTKWYLTVYPNGLDDKCSEYMSVFLHLETTDRHELFTKFKFTLIDSNGTHTCAKEKENRFSVANKNSGFRRYVSKTILNDTTKSLVTSDKLTIYCEVTFITDSHSICGRLGADGQQVLDDFTALFESRKGWDVVLVAGDHELKAHKAILMARSTVFSAMFEHPMEERKQNRVEIKDIDHKVVNELLRYIYTSKVNGLEQLGPELLVAADKYNLVKLKTICENSLRSVELTADNVIQLLVLADMHSTQDLKTRAIHYIKRHANEVMKCEDWKALVFNKPHLMEELLKTERIDIPSKRIKTSE